MFGPVPSVHVRDWASSVSDMWVDVTNQAQRIESTAGQGTGFELTLEMISEFLRDGKHEQLIRMLDQRRNIRALLTIWQDDHRCAKQTMRISFLRTLRSQAVWPPTRMSTSLLIALHLRDFDLLDEWQPGLFDESKTLIRDALKTMSAKQDARDLIGAVHRAPDDFLLVSSPEKIASVLIESGQTLVGYMETSGVHGFDSGRFGDLVRNWYYLEQIRQADPKLEHSFLDELTSESVAKAPAPDGRYFGHHVIEAMTDSRLSEPSRSWIDTIIEIAGDPRLTESPGWHIWWHRVAQYAREQMVRWLSTEDLRLFLAAVERYGEKSGNSDLSRMFPARKKFIEGLHNQGLIRETRLIMGTRAKDAIRAHLGSALRTDVATLEGLSNTSIIYIDCGEFKIIEGSHSFRMWIFIGGEIPLISKRTKRRYTANELREEIPYQHEIDHPFGEHAHVAIVHNGFWQRKALEFIAEWNISIDAEKMLTRDDYSDLRRSGLPVPYQRFSLRK